MNAYKIWIYPYYWIIQARTAAEALKRFHFTFDPYFAKRPLRVELMT